MDEKRTIRNRGPPRRYRVDSKKELIGDDTRDSMRAWANHPVARDEGCCAQSIFLVEMRSNTSVKRPSDWNR